MSDTQSEQERRRAEVVSRHLPEGYSAKPDAIGSYDRVEASTSAPDLLLSSGEESSLKLQGGDIHRDLYKINARANLHQRSATFSHITHRSSDNTNENGELSAPGAFRRQFLLRQTGRITVITTPVTKNFIDFLDLYGGFAGEDLDESDDESAVQQSHVESEQDENQSESTPLLIRRMTSRRGGKPGDASMSKTFFTLIKAFIGTGIMFLPKAFNNGGMLFSSILMLAVSLISCLCFHLLLQCRKKFGGGYGELGEAIGGPRLRSLILASVAISQIGFVCAGIIFTSENLYSFSEAVTNGPSPISTKFLIAIQVIVLIPLALIRNISKLGSAALLADIFILVGLTYIYYFDIATLSTQGIHPTVELFNPQHFTLTVGSAIFTFEGIGLILPIQSSMKEPQKFSRLLYIVMFIITIVYTSVGALCYATFGENTNVEIISNFPQDNKLVNAVQFIYSLAVLIGTPVQLFPAVRIMERKLFGLSSGKRANSIKWKKNAFRSGIVILCAGISILGASDLDKFVALIGSFACIPLVYIYPALMHYKAIATSPLVRFGDIALMVLGVIAMVYTTFITLSQWAGN